MAKKKKSRGRPPKKDNKAKSSNAPFWRQVFAFVLVVLGLFILLGGFGVGGPAPVWIFKLLSKMFGFAAFFSPVIIIYLAVIKFKDEQHIIPIGKLLGGIAVLATMSGVFMYLSIRQTQPN